MSIDYDDFIRLCGVIPEMEAHLSASLRDSTVRDALNGGWAPWIAIRQDGAYFKPPERQSAMTPAELAAIYDCPITDPNVPALAFPCSVEQLGCFLEGYGLYGCVDAFKMAQWLSEQQSRSPDLNKQARQEQAILAALSSKEIDPQSVPRNQPGKPGIKRTIRQALICEVNLFQSAGTFDKAWERLRKDGKLKDA